MTKPRRTPRRKKVAAVLRQSPTKPKPSSRASTIERMLSRPNADETALVSDLGRLMESARRQVAHAANTALGTLYWQIGERIHRHVLKQRRAEYGAQIVSAVGRELEGRYGRGFGERNLRRMVQFAEAFPDNEIVAALLRQLGWTHFTLLIPIREPLKRDFYAEMCCAEGWSTKLAARVAEAHR